MEYIISNINRFNTSYVTINQVAFFVNCAVTFVIGSPNSFSKKLGFDDNKVVSDAYPTLVTPAGYAFAIWGPIFTLQGIFSAFLSFSDYNATVEAFSPFWVGTCLAQACWGFAFGKRKTTLSTMLLFGISLLLNSIHLMTYNVALPEPWITKLPFAMHFSWAVTATILNANIALKQNNFSSQIRSIAAWCSVGFAFLFGTAVAYVRSDPTIVFVTAWALRAISVKEKHAKVLDVDESTIKTFNTVSSVLSIVALVVGASLLCKTMG